MVGGSLLAPFRTGEGGCIAASQPTDAIVQEAVSKAGKPMAIPYCCRAGKLKYLMRDIAPRLLSLHSGHLYAADVL